MAHVTPRLDWPPAIRMLLPDTVEALQRVLAGSLTGVYVHGSLAMGCFTEAASDIDLLIMTTGHVDPSVLRDIGRLLVELSDRAPPKGFEISVVDTGSVHPFVHPAPFLLHYSKRFHDEFEAGTVDLTTPRTDVDLAAHFTMAKARGVRLFGAPIRDALPDVPPAAFLDAVAQDALASVAQIQSGPSAGLGPVPTYGVLNLCRVLAYLADGQLRSKDEGGAWALRHLDPAWRHAVGHALTQYRRPDGQVLTDLGRLVAFATWAGALIERAAADDPCN